MLNAAGEIFGYVVGDDVSSRSIEGENPLYLPQAKVYDRSCALGPGIVPAWAAPDPPFDIALRVAAGDEVAFEGSTSTASITRRFDDLADWLMAALTFPDGAILLTGTGIVPDESFSLRAGDVVTIDIPAWARSPTRSSSSAATRSGAKMMAPHRRPRRRRHSPEELDRLIGAAAERLACSSVPARGRAGWLEHLATRLDAAAR